MDMWPVWVAVAVALFVYIMIPTRDVRQARRNNPEALKSGYGGVVLIAALVFCAVAFALLAWGAEDAQSGNLTVLRFLEAVLPPNSP